MPHRSRTRCAVRRVASVLLALANAAGCSKDREPAPAPPPKPKVAPTYQDPIAGILERRCVRCHAGSGNEGSVAPNLTTYESTASVAKFVALVTAQRKMPPWGADDTGLCGRFQDSHWLEPDEITAFAEWSKAGAPRGTGEPEKSSTRPRPPPVPGTLSLRISSAAYTPTVGAAATRCLLLDAPLAADTLLTGLELTANPVHAVRQADLHALDTAEQTAAAHQLDARDAEPGWACYGSTRIREARLVASWSWGVPRQTMPATSGLTLHAGRPLVLQLRYNVKALGFSRGPVTATLEIATHTAAKRARLLSLAIRGFRLKAAQRQTELSSEFAMAEPLDFHGIVPGMHTLGRTLHLERLRGSESTCLAHFGHWDVYERQLFRYQSGLELKPGDQLRLVCVYDTTSRGQETLQGESIDDEACAAGLYVLPR